jgi:RNA polymerase sigma-70 factor (ECF subfamily)
VTETVRLAAARADRSLAAHIPALKAYFYRHSGNAQSVEDLVQEVILRLHARQGETAIDNIDGYIFTVARSVLTDHARRDRSRHVRSHQTLTENEHPVEERSPDRVIHAREELTLVAAALDELPDRTRDAFLLRRFEDMPYAEIARRLEISVSAVEKHVAKAMLHLVRRVRR